jgi:hypothetical protein
MFVGSFDDDIDGFQADVATALVDMKKQGATRLLLDLTNNQGMMLYFHRRSFRFIFSSARDVGGSLCLGQFLHQYLSGSKSGYPYVLGFPMSNILK